MFIVIQTNKKNVYRVRRALSKQTLRFKYVTPSASKYMSSPSIVSCVNVCTVDNTQKYNQASHLFLMLTGKTINTTFYNPLNSVTDLCTVFVHQAGNTG